MNWSGGKPKVTPAQARAIVHAHKMRKFYSVRAVASRLGLDPYRVKIVGLRPPKRYRTLLDDVAG